VTSITGKSKAESASRATDRVAVSPEGSESAQARAFIAAFYEHAPPADLADRSAQDLAGGALALWHFAARRLPGEALARVYNPTVAHDGWSSPHTIVEIINDDMPFLVDSAAAAINKRDGVVRLVIHPVVTVARDAEGNLTEFGTPGGIRESWMQIAITRELSAAARSALADALRRVLEDVRVAVADWSKMREVLARLSADTAAVPLEPAEIDEGAAFLRWIGDDNFTLLGIRDYDFAGGASQPPLGVLREPTYRAFGGLRDIAALPHEVRDFIHRRELLIIAKTDQRSTVHRNAPMDAIGVRRFDANGEVSGLSLMVGLFTSAAYSSSPSAIPIVRRKVVEVVARSALPEKGHAGRALIHILETFPRDELFQASAGWLHDTAIGVLNLQERQRIALFVRRDPLERFVSCPSTSRASVTRRVCGWFLPGSSKRRSPARC